RGLTIAANLAGGAKSALATNDDLSLNILVKEAMQDRDVVYVVFADEKGIVRAHPDVRVIGHPVARPASLHPARNELLVQTYTRGGAEHIDIGVPLVSGKPRLGTLYVGFSKSATSTAVSQARNQAMGITAFMVIVGVAGAVALATLLARPIYRLMDAT